MDKTVNSTVADDMQSKAYREAKATRHLHEMELHSTMPVTDQVGVMRVIGGWIYYNTGYGNFKWSSFVPSKRFG